MFKIPQFEQLSTFVYSSGWEVWPPIYRKYIHILLILVQRPRYLSGFGLFKCDLNTFTEVNFFSNSF